MHKETTKAYLHNGPLRNLKLVYLRTDTKEFLFSFTKSYARALQKSRFGLNLSQALALIWTFRTELADQSTRFFISTSNFRLKLGCS